jgi:guanylate kinase
MKLVLIGESGSGKDTIATILNRSYGVHIVKSHTTRSKRIGECDTYIFASYDQYENDKNDGLVFEDTKFGDNYYWTLYNDFDHKNWIIIVDINGVFNLKREFPDCKVVYVKCDYKKRMERVNDYDRVKRDVGKFNSIPCDYVIDNNSDLMIIDLVPNIIKMWEYFKE